MVKNLRKDSQDRCHKRGREGSADARSEPRKQQVVTAEHYDRLREMGFVPFRDKDGRLWFVARDVYAEEVAAGKFEGSSVH